MHPNPAFRKETEDRNIAFARERAFGALAVNAADGPLLSHIPFVLSEDAKTVELHLVRSNPILRLLEEPLDAVIAVVGGDSYVSPDWYEVDDQVPTWNYVAVHLRGKLRKLPQSDLHDVLNRLSASMEARLLPKKPWTSEKMDQEIYEKMQRQIVPALMDVVSIDGTWKLSQNKPDKVRIRAAKEVQINNMGSETKLLSELMKDVES
ncbi:MAG: FMN-binding negative transcriptional regulator [Rhizobiaceae bacterium]|nr:FMN-binding negative transcriptional regulator [Rhizobiaceae bacterium]